MNNFTLLRSTSLLFFCLCSFLSLQAQSGGLLINPMTSCNDKIIDVEIRTDTWSNVTSMQFTLEWDPAILEFIDVFNPNNTFADVQFGENNTVNGKLNASWYDNSASLEGISVEDEVTFVVQFKVNGVDGEMSDINFIGNPTVIEFTYNNNGNIAVYDPILVDGLVKMESPYLDGAPSITNAYSNDADGAISINIAGGTGPYDYKWNNDMTDATINNLVAGDYSCTVTDNSTCSSVQGPFVVESTPSSTRNIAGLTQFELSPNPATSFANVNVAFDKSEKTNIRILDVTGKTQYQTSREAASFQLNIPVTELANGTYFLELSTSEGTAVEKLIIAK